MNEESTIRQDSPRLAWLKRNKVRLNFSAAAKPPYSAWLPQSEYQGNEKTPYVAPYVSGSLPRDPDACGYGTTEDEALADLATRHAIPLWNEPPRP